LNATCPEKRIAAHTLQPEYVFSFLLAGLNEFLRKWLSYHHRVEGIRWHQLHKLSNKIFMQLGASV
jgi:DNA-binding ferritin-like protein